MSASEPSDEVTKCQLLSKPDKYRGVRDKYTKMMVWEAYKKVKSNKGSAGIDQQTLDDFDKVRSKELYKIWNRLASGSYFSSEVKRVEIRKMDGKTRPLGIPTVSDRIAQQVIKTFLEPRLELEFLGFSFRPIRMKLKRGEIPLAYSTVCPCFLFLCLSVCWDNHTLWPALVSGSAGAT